MAGLAAVMTLASSAAVADDTLDFLSQGRVMLDTRYRFENVDQHGFSKSADADTIRERLGYETSSLWDLKALVEI